MVIDCIVSISLPSSLLSTTFNTFFFQMTVLLLKFNLILTSLQENLILLLVLAFQRRCSSFFFERINVELTTQL